MFFSDSQVVEGSLYGTGLGPIALDNVFCSGDEANLLECAFSTDTTEDSHDQDVAVVCAILCSDNEIRVVEGSSQTEGRVEICFNQLWGTVTDDFWSFLDATVACRQLGFSDQCKTTATCNPSMFIFAFTYRVLLTRQFIVGLEIVSQIE